MLQHAKNQMLISNNRGFTLIELLVAVLILLVGLLGTLQGVNVAIQENMKNEFRNTAVSIAEGDLATKKSRPFDRISTTIAPQIRYTSAQIRSFSKQYKVVNQVDDTGTNTKNIQVGVSWTHKGVPYEQQISTLVSNPNAN